MLSQAQRASPPARRIQIRDRNHAREIARGIAFGTLFQNGGTVEGFADWLFVHRQSFNGANPLQQARVYANRHRSDKRRGIDFDATCRAKADEWEEFSRQAEVAFKAVVAAIEALWTKTTDGQGIVLAIAELWLGRGRHFADSPDGEALSDPTSWVLEGLLQLLERFGGPDGALDEFEWRRASAEDHFRKMTPLMDKDLTRICREVCHHVQPSEWYFRRVARAISVLADLSRVRLTLRTLLTKVQMVERIEASASVAINPRPAPARRRREV